MRPREEPSSAISGPHRRLCTCLLARLTSVSRPQTARFTVDTQSAGPWGWRTARNNLRPWASRPLGPPRRPLRSDDRRGSTPCRAHPQGRKTSRPLTPVVPHAVTASAPDHDEARSGSSAGPGPGGAGAHRPGAGPAVGGGHQAHPDAGGSAVPGGGGGCVQPAGGGISRWNCTCGPSWWSKR